MKKGAKQLIRAPIEHRLMEKMTSKEKTHLLRNLGKCHTDLFVQTDPNIPKRALRRLVFYIAVILPVPTGATRRWVWSHET